MKTKPKERHRYLVHMWEYDSYAIRDTHRNRIDGWSSNVVRAAKRSTELNQAYARL